MRNGHGRYAETPAQVPLRGWWQILKRTYAESNADNVGLIAAGVAFYGFLAFVPLLLALVLTYGLVVDPAEVATHIAKLTQLVPAEAAKLIDEQLAGIVDTAAGKKGLGLAAALALSLYGAMKGAGAIVTALGIVYEQPPARGFFVDTLVNAAITLAAVLIAIALLLSISATAFLEDLAGRIDPLAAAAVKVAAWGFTAALASAAVAALFRWGPSRADARWVWLTPGSVFVTAGLAVATLGFGWYAANFGDYNATYGSLGAVVVLLFWLWLSAYVLLLGAELNAELERQTAFDTTTGPPVPLGRRGAAMADEAVAPD